MSDFRVSQLLSCLIAATMLGSVLSSSAEDEISLLSLEKARTDLVIPSPPELFAALLKTTKPGWRQYYLPPVLKPVSDRNMAAMSLGIIMTDAFIACEAGETQKIHNLARDIHNHEKTLGLSDTMRPRLYQLTDLADSQNWEGVRFELQAAVEEQVEMLQKQKDDDLGRLVRAGLWIRTFHVASQIVRDKKLKEQQLCVGCHMLVFQITDHLEALKPANKRRKNIKLIRDKMRGIRQAWPVQAESLTPLESQRNSAQTLKDLSELISLVRPE